MERETGDELRVLQAILERHAAGEDIVVVAELSAVLGRSVTDVFAHLVELDERGLVRLTLGSDSNHVVVLSAEGHQYVQAQSDGHLTSEADE